VHAGDEALGAAPKHPVIFECVGMPGVIDSVIDGAPLFSRVVVVGVCVGVDQITPAMAINKEIDLRFVLDLTTGGSLANALSQGLSGLVNGMHLTGIAEGIETRMQADILRAQGWECGQGFYFAMPAAIPVTH